MSERKTNQTLSGTSLGPKKQSRASLSFEDMPVFTKWEMPSEPAPVKEAAKAASQKGGAAKKKTNNQNAGQKGASGKKGQGKNKPGQKAQKAQNGKGKGNAQAMEKQKAERPKPAGQPVQKKQTGAKKQPAKQALRNDAAPSISTNFSPKKGGKKGKKNPPIRIIPLGGLNEIGKNLTVYECQDDIFLVDCGLAFPDETMLGVDLVIPDFSYLVQNKEKIRGVVITHGHEDHIGSLTYLLKQIDLPVYGTKLTIGLVEGKLKEAGLLGRVKTHVVTPGDRVKLGCMEVEFVRVNHSIPDAVAIVTHAPCGTVVQTGDFKIDYTPIGGGVIDLARFGELGSRGVLLLLSDSTNAERPGSTTTERKVGQSFDNLFKTAEDKRIIIATFSSNIQRIQQICDAAVKFGRCVAISGRSMENVTGIARELGYLHVPEGLIVPMEELSRFRPSETVIITTGSQGEPMSALSRMSMGSHRQVTVGKGDFIIISATPIPGNEKLVSRVVNELLRSGADVIYESMYDVHVSGHACQEELKLMMELVRPKYFMPVHGEFKHLKRHADLARSLGIPDENIIISEIGRVLETDGTYLKNEQTVPAGRVLVDGLGVGDVGSVVLRDRKLLSEDGLVIIVVTVDGLTGEVLSGPDVVSRGFVYMRESEEVVEEFRNLTLKVLDSVKDRRHKDWNDVKVRIKEAVSSCVYRRMKRSPMILPIVMEV